MTDIKALASQVKLNCNISDAKFWGGYSLCGLLLRLRELYRIEQGLGLLEKIHQKEIGEWISERESLWTELEGNDFESIFINGNVYGPFDVQKINSELCKDGLIYGAGYGLHMKPSFFIADLISSKKANGFDIYIAGHEFARDLSNYPAVLQDRSIFARVETTKLLLWQRFEELRCKGSKGPLTFAFSQYGISPEDNPSEAIEKRIYLIACSEAETYIYHEIGEAFEGEKIGDEWKAFLTSFSYSKSEIFMRSVKDMLSDTSEKGLLRNIIENQKEGSLGFYIVFLSGMRKLLFPEILDAFKMFTDTGDWIHIENARIKGYHKAIGYTERMLTLLRTQKSEHELILKYIEEEILKKEFSL